MLLLNICKISELSGLFVCLGKLVKFSVLGGTEKIAGLFFAREGSVLRQTLVNYFLKVYFHGSFFYIR